MAGWTRMQKILGHGDRRPGAPSWFPVGRAEGRSGVLPPRTGRAHSLSRAPARSAISTRDSAAHVRAGPGGASVAPEVLPSHPAGRSGGALPKAYPQSIPKGRGAREGRVGGERRDTAKNPLRAWAVGDRDSETRDPVETKRWRGRGASPRTPGRPQAGAGETQLSRDRGETVRMGKACLETGGD